MENENVKSIGKTEITLSEKDNEYSVKVLCEAESEIEKISEEKSEILDLTCKGCGNLKGGTRKEPKLGDKIFVKHSYWLTPRDEIPDIISENKNLDDDFIEKSLLDKKEEMVEFNSIVDVMSHNIKQTIVDETLPPSEELFEDSEELKFEILDKKISLDDADYSDCPKEWYPKIRELVDNYEDRFSKFKLDLEVTDLYEADLDTIPGRKVIQKVRPLSNHKFDFALKAVRQLEAAGTFSLDRETLIKSV